MGNFMEEYFRTILEHSKAIQTSNDELMKATLIAIGYHRGVEEARAASPPTQTNPLKVNTGGESCDTEGKMLVDVPGVSMTSKPRADGRYQAVITRDGKRKYLYGRTPEEVKIKIQLYLREHGTAPRRKPKERPKGPTFREFFSNWAEMYKKPTLKPKSYEIVQRVQHIASASLGDKPIGSITSDDLQAFFVGMGATRTRDLCAVYIGQVFAHAVRTGAIKRDPMDAVQLSHREAEKRSALTPEEQAAFFAAARGCAQELLFRFLLATGLRIGEALALTPEDIDAERNAVRVNKDIVFVGGEAIVQPPKSKASVRTVPVPAELCKTLAAVRGPRAFNVGYNAVRMAFRRVSKSCGVNVSAHILRHTYATRLEEAGIPPKVKQYLMGHASLEMTQGVYTDAQSHYVDGFADRVRDAFDIGSRPDRPTI